MRQLQQGTGGAGRIGRPRAVSREHGLRLLGCGRSNREIAADLDVEESTARTHVNRTACRPACILEPGPRPTLLDGRDAARRWSVLG